LAHCAGGLPRVDGTFSFRQHWLRRGWRRAGEVYEKSFEMRHFRVSAYSEEAELAPVGAPESLGMEEMRETAPTEAVGCTLDGGQEAKLIE
jgi:hypothetical protein